MKYITLRLHYCNGEDNLIMNMSRMGWGLMNKVAPDYPTGRTEAYYTFVGGEHAKDVEDCDFTGRVILRQPPEFQRIDTNV